MGHPWCLVFFLVAVVLVQAEEGWHNFDFKKNPSNRRSGPSTKVEFVPEDGAIPPPWLFQPAPQTDNFQTSETKVQSFFDDVEIEAPKQWLPAYHNTQESSPPTIRESNPVEDYWPVGGVTQQPTSSKRAQPSVKETSPKPPSKLPDVAAHGKPPAEVYHAQNPVKPPQKAAAARPNYYDSSEYYDDYYEYEEVEKEDFPSFFEQPTTKLPSFYRPSSQKPQRPKVNADPLTKTHSRPPASIEIPDWASHTTEKPLPERQKPTDFYRPKSTKKPGKVQHREPVNFEDDYEPFAFEQQTFSTTEHPLPPVTVRRNTKPKTTTVKPQEPVTTKRIKPKNPSYGNQPKWQEEQEEKPDFHPEPIGPSRSAQFESHFPIISQQADGFLESHDQSNYELLEEKEFYQTGRRPTSSRPPTFDLGSTEEAISEYNKPPHDPPKVFITQRPSRPTKRPSPVYQRPTEPIDFLDGLRALKNVPFGNIPTTEANPSLPNRKPSSNTKPSQKIPSPFDLVPDAAINLGESKLRAPSTSKPTVASIREKPSRRPVLPTFKERLNQKTAAGAKEPTEYIREQDQLYVSTTAPADFTEPKPFPVVESSTEAKTEEEVRPSSTLFPPFSKRVRPPTTLPPGIKSSTESSPGIKSSTESSPGIKSSTESSPGIKSSTESSPGNSGHKRITSYKQRIEAMKEQAKQREQQSQQPSKQTKESEAVVEQETVISSTTSTTARPSTTRPKVPPRMPTRKPLFSSTTTTTAQPKTMDDDEDPPLPEQPRKRFKPKFNSAPTTESQGQESSEKIPSLPKNQNHPLDQPKEQEPHTDVEKELAEENRTPSDAEPIVPPMKVKGRHRPSKNDQPSTTTESEQTFMIEPLIPLAEPEQQDQEDVPLNIELFGSPEQQGTAEYHHSDEIVADGFRHQDDHEQQPKEQSASEGFLRLPHQAVPMSPDLSDPVSKARKQFFAMATHDPILPIEELLNIRVRDM